MLHYVVTFDKETLDGSTRPCELMLHYAVPLEKFPSPFLKFLFHPHHTSIEELSMFLNGL